MRRPRQELVRALIRLAVLVTAVVVLGAFDASACPVCYGESDSAMASGINNGILALLAVIGGVQVAFVALFVNLRKRARSLRTEGSEDPIEQELK